MCAHWPSTIPRTLSMIIMNSEEKVARLVNMGIPCDKAREVLEKNNWDENNAANAFFTDNNAPTEDAELQQASE